MKPLILLGHEALSGFRLKTLLQGMRKADPSIQVSSVDARFVYLLEAREELSDDMFKMAADLLGTGERFALAGGFFVTPRKGTISPWSSKATDIFHNCGLDQILRVERGIHYRAHADGRERRLAELGRIIPLLHDRMTEGIYEDVSDMFRHIPPAPIRQVDVIAGGKAALERINVEWGLALSGEEIEYLYEAYRKIGRNPTDVELVMFGQANSEHCRHKIFNATWVVDGKKQDKSLFDMIRNTHAKTPGGTLSAYRDNSAVMEGFKDGWFLRKGDGSGVYGYIEDQIDILVKVETHNHPTAICPFPGAATGVGGEIRDEAATGTSGKTKAGLSAFMVSHLRIPGYAMPWEKDYAEFPSRLATPLQIMLEGPIGGAAFGNEFGRPQLCGLFRTLEHLHGDKYRGYHKPVMAAGGMGNLRRGHVAKKEISGGALIMQIGGPAMKIGLGGGAASSMATGSNAEALDFDSVQRGNAEMQRRCQEVIDACIAMGGNNPILSVHDIGAGGLSNGCPELVSETGGAFELRKIPCVDSSMSPMEIWCCEAQERYVLAIAPESLDLFRGLCERERCPMAVLGRATGNMHLGLQDDHFNNKPIDLDIRVILGKPPKMVRTVKRLAGERKSLDLSGITLSDAVERILRFPAVAAKTFLITIADRSVTGLVARDQMVGPYQVPISDCAVTTTTLKAYTGEAMAMGERTSLAEESGPASGRMAVGEALTNMVGVDIGEIGKIKLSANWMCACGEPGEDAALFDTVKAIGMELCPKLGVAIPVGKDSLSMRTLWRDSHGRDWRMTAPLTLVITGFAPVRDVRRTVTADIKADVSVLFLADLGAGRNRLGCSALAQVYDRAGGDVPDLDDPDMVVRYWKAVQEMVGAGLLLAYHDRSDGGLFAALAEMSFGGRRGLTVDLKDADLLPALFAEELGGVLQVREKDAGKVSEIAARHGLAGIWKQIGVPDASRTGGDLCIKQNGNEVYRKPVCRLHSAWAELTARMQGLRDNPECAKQEWEATRVADDPGMAFKLSYDPACKTRSFKKRPRMAILREQGVNGHVEMAGAFDRAGFESVDVHMTDLLRGRVNLDNFAGFVACGGFSYGDVLGAGSGWAKSVLFNPRIKEMFARFFARPDSFALGVCNGCQMVSQLKGIIPGAESWPEFTRNKSEQFEARYATVEIMPSPSIFLRGMEGSILPIPVAHGEGYADFSRTGSAEGLKKQKLESVRFVDNRGKATEMYPFNPNGSAGGLTGVTTIDGRVTILMPHPERGFRSVQMSYRPRDMFCSEKGPWLRMFQNAREFAG